MPTVGLLLLTSFIAVFSFANFESTLSLQIEKLVQQLDAGPPASSVLSWLVEKARAWGYGEADEIKLVVIFAVFAYLGFSLTLAQGFLVRRLADKVSEGLMATVGGVTATLGFVLLARRGDR